MSSRAEQLHALGQSVWLDFIRRGHLNSGEFAQLVRDAGVVGVTSNPTIFQQAIAGSADYDEDIARLSATGLTGQPLFDELAVADIQHACDLLRPVFDRTDGLDGRVSIEVSPGRAHDTPATLTEARKLHQAVARPNVMIKVPATAEGIPAITELTAEAICVNVTLIFSLARYQQVMEAYLLGLERRAAAGQPLADIYSVASFFVSRVDSKVDSAIDAAAAAATEATVRSDLLSLRGQAAVANARLAYAAFRRIFGSPRFATLAARGARVQRPLWASTSTKNPAYSDTLYVDELIGRDTVNTMPPATLIAYNDHGALELRIERGLDRAEALFHRLPKLGIPLEALIAQLEPEGVASFVKSFESLLGTLDEKRLALQQRSRS